MIHVTEKHHHEAQQYDSRRIGGLPVLILIAVACPLSWLFSNPFTAFIFLFAGGVAVLGVIEYVRGHTKSAVRVHWSWGRKLAVVLGGLLLLVLVAVLALHLWSRHQLALFDYKDSHFAKQSFYGVTARAIEHSHGCVETRA